MLAIQSLLVVDDNEAERQIMVATLGAAFPGAEIHSTADAAGATLLNREQLFDCILVDYNMPLVDGLTLAGELRAASAYLPIVLMTSLGDEMLAFQALRNGVSDYIPKSRINIDSIRRTVDRAMHASAQAQLIDEQREELENFAYALAHDFKQPIRQIVTFTQLIADDERLTGMDGVREHLDFLNLAARRLGKLVDVMSQYTLLNEPPEIGEVDLSKVIDSIRISIDPYLSERGAQLVLTGATPIMWGNETLMTQVLQNLIMNGVQYNKSAAPRVAVAARVFSKHCVITIEDNGLGIEADYIAEIFKPLVRLHTAVEYPGSGLGLTLARKATLAQGGSIWCDSEPGRGSVFSVKVPLARPGPGARRERRRKTGRLGSGTAPTPRSIG